MAKVGYNTITILVCFPNIHLCFFALNNLCSRLGISVTYIIRIQYLNMILQLHNIFVSGISIWCTWNTTLESAIVGDYKRHF